MDTLARGLRNAAKLIKVVFLSQLLAKFWQDSVEFICQMDW